MNRPISLLFAPKDNPALVASGYGKTAQYITPQLQEAGYDVRLHCTVGHQYNTMLWTEPHSGREMEIWSGGNGAYGEDITPVHLNRLAKETNKPGILLFCGDVVALNEIPRLAKSKQILAMAWTAADWDAPTPQHALDKFGGFLTVTPFSHHGHQVLSLDNLPNLLPPAWLGCNTDIWQPIHESQLEKEQQEMGYHPNGFNIFSCFANQYQRKGEYEMLMAIGEFHNRHPEARIHFYGLTQTRREWDLYALIDHLRIKELVTFSDDYSHIMGDYKESDVCRMMNASDVVLSLGFEGFGLQTIEAQAINKPVIGFDAGATPELLRSGILIPPEKESMVPSMFRRPLPNGLKVVEALETIWRAKQEGHKWDNGRKWVTQNLTWRHSAKSLIDRIQLTEQLIADEELIGPPIPSHEAEERASNLINIRGA